MSQENWTPTINMTTLPVDNILKLFLVERDIIQFSIDYDGKILKLA